MKEIITKFNLKGYKVLSFSLYGKQNCPFIGIICNKQNKKYFIKTPLIKNNISKSILNKEFKLFQKFFPELNPKLKDWKLTTKFIQNPSLSYYLTNHNNKKIKMAIDWLIEFHNTKHINGIGQIHGDFSFDDIIPLKEKIIVLDWEDYDPKKEQIIDLYYLLFRIFMKKNKITQKSINKFIHSINGDSNQIHPILKYYINQRKIKFNKTRRQKAFIDFLEFRIKRQNRLYNIPSYENYVYKYIKQIIKN